MAVAEAERVAVPRWINLRTVLGLVLFVVALMLGVRVLESERALVPVWVAATDLAVDTVLTETDLRLVDVRLPADLLEGYRRGATPVEGMTLTRTIAAGEMIPRSAVAPAASTTPGRVMTLPIEAEHAMGGALAAGDWVDVYATFSANGADAQTVLIASAVEVVDVVTAETVVMAESTPQGVTIKADASTAAKLAFAIRTGAIDIIKVTGAATDAAVGPRYIRLEDLAP